MLDDFANLKMEVYKMQMSEGKLSPDMEEKNKNLGSVISMNLEVALYLQAEPRVAVIWEDVMKILINAVGIKTSLE